MAAEMEQAEACTHACQFACGRKYDVIVIQIVDGSTTMMCIPCFMSFAHSVMVAMVEPNNPAVQEVMAGTNLEDVLFVPPGADDDSYTGPEYTPPADEFVFTGED